jgi:3-hydroxyacyl-CoA dehydrogenase/enoyl-CoA hydratase/3-hydroxybutyryl-CoA epimerase
MSKKDQDTMIGWESTADGVVILTMDDPDAPVNTMNATYIAAMGAALDRLERERDREGGQLSGIVLTSAKRTFFAGGNLDDLLAVRPEDVAAFSATTSEIKLQLRRLETLGVPLIAAINGSALGGGLEIALACHHRIALDAPGVVVGLPEVGLGLLPGGGGIVRTVRLLGISDALTKVLLQGQRHSVADALEIGLIDEAVSSPEELRERALAWIASHPGARQRWDELGYRMPGGTPSSPGLAALLPAFPANLRKQLKGAPLSAPQRILAAAVEGAQVDVDTAGQIETRYLAELVTGQTAKNMMQAFFFDMQHITKGGSRPAGHPAYQASTVLVVGAGMMGAGIAYSCARAGLRVILKDVNGEAASRGRDYSAKLLGKAVDKGKITAAERDAVLGRIHPTDQADDAAGADLVIEAVFEDPALKAKVFGELEPLVAPDALLGSNTSTLPITGLAEAVTRPADFIGLHFFSPVDKMQLLEIVVGVQTSDAALARAIDFARQIGKVPIVVNDSRGFFTSRVIGKFLDEAVAMVGEGIEPASIEQAGGQGGYPAPPLQLMDELTLTLPRKVREETKAAVLAANGTWPGHPAEPVMDRMIDELGRRGRSVGGGFYEYQDGQRTGLWPGLRNAFGSGRTQIPFQDMKERMLFAESIETVRCLDEGVLRSIADANVGSILGIGFPAWTGGTIQFINGYPGGLAGFVTRARELSARYGPRFAPPASLVARAERGGKITDPSAQSAVA